MLKEVNTTLTAQGSFKGTINWILLNIKLEKIKLYDKRINKRTLDFYKENKKVSNKKIKSMLDWEPKFSNYRLGIKKILDSDL